MAIATTVYNNHPISESTFDSVLFVTSIQPLFNDIRLLKDQNFLSTTESKLWISSGFETLSLFYNLMNTLLFHTKSARYIAHTTLIMLENELSSGNFSQIPNYILQKNFELKSELQAYSSITIPDTFNIIDTIQIILDTLASAATVHLMPCTFQYYEFFKILKKFYKEIVFITRTIEKFLHERFKSIQNNKIMMNHLLTQNSKQIQ